MTTVTRQELAAEVGVGVVETHGAAFDEGIPKENTKNERVVVLVLLVLSLLIVSARW